MKMRFVAMVAGLLGLAGVGCSGTGSACMDAMAVYCARACECDPGSTCAFDGGGTTISFDSYDECLGFFGTLGCGQPAAANVDWAACETAAGAAACSGGGVSNVTACEIRD